MPIQAAFALPHPPIICPEVGRGEEAKIARTAEAFKTCANIIAELKPDTIVVTSPHSRLYADYFHISSGAKAYGDLKQFRAGSAYVEKEYDGALISGIEKAAGVRGIPAGMLGGEDVVLDHGTIIPLRFVDKAYENYKLVRIGLSGLGFAEHFRLGEAIAEVVSALNRNVVFIASGDMSHKLKADGPYGLAEEGAVFDKQVTDIFSSGNLSALTEIDPLLADKAAECGLRSFIIMAGALAGQGGEFSSELLSYEGTFGVGYAVAAFKVKQV